MAIVRSVSSEKTLKSLFQTLIKAFRLQEAKETVLLFDNYSKNQESCLKQQEIINRVTNGTVKVYMGENTQQMPQSKAYQQYFENTENKAELIDQFTQYIQKVHVHSPLKENVIFNSRDVTYRINSCSMYPKVCLPC